MKIVRVLGGLGNQMFQYAFAVALQERFSNEKILIDKLAFKGYPHHDGFLLKDIFEINIPTATLKEVWEVNYPIVHYRMWQVLKKFFPKLRSIKYEERDLIYDPSVFNLSRSIYYDGYWQSEEYFRTCRDKILNVFTFPELRGKNLDLINNFKSKCVVSIHIRRGDYVEDPLFSGIAGKEYYIKAITLIRSMVDVDNFMIFSNDITWCKENITQLLGNTESVFVDWNTGKKAYIDMQLMSLASHNIVANSSFSWWGAWLNKNKRKIVIAPKKWINDQSEDDIVPSSWIRV